MLLTDGALVAEMLASAAPALQTPLPRIYVPIFFHCVVSQDHSSQFAAPFYAYFPSPKSLILGKS